MAAKRLAICYDFDKTLAPDDMQAFTFIPSLGMRSDDFWKETNLLANQNGMERNLAWMWLMIEKAKEKNISIQRAAFQALGQDIQLYQGVEQWFQQIDDYAAQRNLAVDHYIISSGLKEIIEGSCIGHHFKRIYASSFYYGADDVARWPAQAVNYTNKTQYIFRIAKGALEENDDSVNQTMPEDQLYVPYENMIYIGDSETDIPCMRLVKSKGGTSIGVFDPQKDNRRRVYELFHDGRINYYAPADYRPDQQLFRLMQKIIDHIATRESLKEVFREQKEMAEHFAAYTALKSALATADQEGEAPEELLSALKEQVEGNID
ncbi:MAG: haloacid dehalogenase-like hydrolase [Clostridia bacterium]|nr:haloacid dehalogenase-like hydrolase [Clostridia bacterium]